MITVNISGVDELLKDIREASIDVQDEAYGVLGKQAAAIRDDAKDRCPVGETGALKKSIRSRVSRKKLVASVSAGEKVDEYDAYYAQFVEFGTKKASAQPFLYPAGRAHEEETKEKLTGALLGALKKGVEG